MNYQIFDITFDETEDIGLSAVSFVDLPAICQDFVYFSNNQKFEPSAIKQGSILMANADKREVISPLLIPNQLILRKDEQGNKYYVRWTAETIQKVAQYYVANQFLNNFTVMHSWFETQSGNYTDSFIKDVYCLKFWLIEDEKNDEINKKYGYHLPKGTLCIHLKIHNRKLWAKIKSGELKGLSIEAFCGQVPAGSLRLNKSTNNITQMKKNNIKARLAQAILKYNEIVDELKDLETLVEEDVTESAEVELKYYTSDTDYIVIAADGTATASDGTVVDDGEYSLVDGSILVIEEGKFKETRPVGEAEDVPEEAPITEEKEEEETPSDETEEDDEEKKEETQEEVEVPYTLVDVEIDGVTYPVPQEVADYIKTLEEANGELEVTSENFRKEIVQMQKRIPSIEPIRRAGNEEKKETVVDYSVLIQKLNK